MHRVRKIRHGFTLVELLVVMAVIAVFLGVLGTAMSGNSPTVATQGAQRTLSGLITGARGQAILHQAEVRLIVHCDPPTSGDPQDVQQEKRDRYLRYIGMVVKEVDFSVTPPVERWRPLNQGVFLPQGVYIVPPTGLSTTELPTTVISPNDTSWAHERRSIVAMNSGTPTTETYEFNSDHPAQTYFHISFDGRGRITSDFNGNEGRLIVAPARQTPMTPVFEDRNDNYVLGGVLRTYGSMTLVHQPEGFPEVN